MGASGTRVGVMQPTRGAGSPVFESMSARYPMAVICFDLISHLRWLWLFFFRPSRLFFSMIAVTSPTLAALPSSVPSLVHTWGRGQGIEDAEQSQLVQFPHLIQF